MHERTEKPADSPKHAVAFTYFIKYINLGIFAEEKLDHRALQSVHNIALASLDRTTVRGLFMRRLQSESFAVVIGPTL